MSTYSDLVLATRPDKLLAYYRLDNTANDSAPAGRDGTATDVTWVDGGIQGARRGYFPTAGTSEVDFNSAFRSAFDLANGAVRGTLALSLEMDWSIATSSNVVVLYGDASNEIFLSKPSANTLTINHRAGGTLISTSINGITSGAHQVIVTWDTDNNSMRAYLDGDLESVIGGFGTFAANLSASTIGVSAAYTPYASDIAFWSTPLTQLQITTLYQEYVSESSSAKLPIIPGGCTPILYISDNVNFVDLLGANDSGEGIVGIASYVPAVAELKGGGIWQSSPFVDGGQIVMGVYDLVDETFILSLQGSNTDQIALQMQKIRRLLQKARSFWLGRDNPVYLIARAAGETNTRFALIHNGSIPKDAAYYQTPFIQPFEKRTIDRVDMKLRRSHWISKRPGESDAVSMYAVETFNGVEYGTVDYSLRAVNETEAIVGNKNNIANITNIHNSTSGSNLLDLTVPWSLFDGTTEVYFGIDDSVTGEGPFSSLVFNLSQEGTGQPTITWEYISATSTWSSLNILSDYQFDTYGVGSLHFEQPQFFQESPGGSLPSGSWVRARISSGSFVTEPRQTEPNIYTATWSRFNMDIDQVEGDIPALASMELSAISSDGDKADVGDEWGAITRVMGGIRSLDRGADFRASINCDNDQNPTGVTLTAVDGTSSTSVGVDGHRSPTDNHIALTIPSSFVQTVYNPFKIDLDSDAINTYRGRYRALVRFSAEMTGVTSRFRSYIRVSMTNSSGSYAAAYEDTEYTTVQSIGNTLSIVDGILTFDYGEVVLPLNSGIQIDDIDNLHCRIDLFLQSPSENGGTVRFLDFWLIPTDEWSFDTFIPVQSDQEFVIANDYRLVIDNIGSSDPKSYIVSNADSSRVSSIPIITSGLFRLNTVKAQTMHLMSYMERADSTLAPLDGPRSNPEACLSVKLYKQEQYLALRGDA